MPVQQKLNAFLTTLPDHPFQLGSSLNAAGINYKSVPAMHAMKRLNEWRTFPAPASEPE